MRVIKIKPITEATGRWDDDADSLCEDLYCSKYDCSYRELLERWSKYPFDIGDIIMVNSSDKSSTGSNFVTPHRVIPTFCSQNNFSKTAKIFLTFRNVCAIISTSLRERLPQLSDISFIIFFLAKRNRRLTHRTDDEKINVYKYGGVVKRYHERL